ncbi:MAG: Na(+)-translocating NADH-quinone reductase subunit A, partial [Chlorobi bacterium]|nr:Na(+)-translocating NADH-quinone reductase subunit A [Chlorobiota bacterium]
MSKVVNLKKGLDIRMKGKAEKIFVKADFPQTFAIKPTDFPGLTPKLDVKVDAEVKAGSTLFYDKNKPEIKFTSPVSGKVIAINRGERRKILEVVVQADSEIKYESFKKADPSSLSKDEIKENLLNSGLWPFIKQRPYAVIAKPDDEPKAIFISGFDSSPLAPDFDFVVKGESEAFQKGIDTLSKLTSGKIHLSLNSGYPPADVFTNAKGVEFHYFKGPHPAGNVGVQIHHIDPVNKNDVVWTIGPWEVIMIGKLFMNGQISNERIVALTGSEVVNPRYIKTYHGANISSIIKDNIKTDNVRYISGNVLTGTKVEHDGFLGFYDSQITVIPEGNYYEMFGWALPGFKKFSQSHSFFSWLFTNKEYKFDTNYHGGERAFVFSGEYEKVVPMDIYPVH